MTDLKSILQLPYGLASFNNKELYYIISNLFGLGAYGDQFIEKERLYLNFEEEFYIRFLFICTTPMLSESQTTPETVVYYGRFDEDFEDIEIYGGSVPFDVCRADRNYQPDGFRFSELFAKSERKAIKPIVLIQGLLNIIENSDIKTRKINDAFSLVTRTKAPEVFHIHFNIYGNFVEEEKRHKDFSGLYHLTARPIVGLESEKEKRGTIVYEYEIESNEYSIFSDEINESEMTRWEAKINDQTPYENKDATI